MDKFFKTFSYDKLELFTCLNGDRRYLHFKGQTFLDKTKGSANTRDVLVIIPGSFGCSNDVDICKIVKYFYEHGYDVAVIN